MKFEITLNRNNWKDLETFVGDINAIAFNAIEGANKRVELEKPHSKYKKIYGFGEIRKEYTIDGDIKYTVNIKDNFFNRSLDILKDMFKPFISFCAIFDGSKFKNLSEDMAMLYSEEEENKNE